MDLRLRPLMDEGRGLIVNLARGRLGEDACIVLGGLLVNTLSLAAFSCADSSAEGRRPFFLYVDEFQNFTTLAFVNMTAELRKYGVGITLANQHLDQLAPNLRSAILDNARTLISFRIGAADAMDMAREFQPVFGVEDLINLANRDVYLGLMMTARPACHSAPRSRGIGGRKTEETRFCFATICRNGKCRRRMMTHVT